MNDRVYKLTTMIAERVSALQSDGYTLIAKSTSTNWGMWKLRHKSNGNRISIVADFNSGGMLQRTNDKLVYDGPIQP